MQLSPGVLLLANALWPEESINVDVIIGTTIQANKKWSLVYTLFNSHKTNSANTTRLMGNKTGNCYKIILPYRCEKLVSEMSIFRQDICSEVKVLQTTKAKNPHTPLKEKYKTFYKS